jgi:hypothetical protein
MPFYDYIRIRGIQSDFPEMAIVEGIGSNSNGAAGSPQNPISVEASFTQVEAEIDPAWLTCLASWQESISDWLLACEEQESAQEEIFATGLEYEALEFPEIPTLELPVPLPPGTPPAIPIIMGIVRLLLLALEVPAVRAIIRKILRTIKWKGGNDPMIQLYKKFSFLREGEILPPEDLTSLHLLNADKPISIHIDKGWGNDVFLDFDTEEE